MNLPNFWYGTSLNFDSFRETNHTVSCWSKIWSFLLKNQVFGHFLRNCTSDLSKTWSETWDNYFESSNGNVVSRKILVLPVVKNTLLVVTLYGFGLFLAIFFQTVDDFLLIFAI